MTDVELIEDIRAGGKKMEVAIELFYNNNFNIVYDFMHRFKLTREDVLDAYADAVIQFRTNILKDQFRKESKCSTYLFSIFRNKCIDVVRKNKTNTSSNTNLLTSLELVINKVDNVTETRMDRTLAFQYLERLSDVCRNVLMDWNDDYSMEEIAARNGLLNAHTARSKRYNCFRQLMAIVRNTKVEVP